MILFLYFIPIIISQLPQEYKNLVNQAIENSKTKVPKELRQETKFPGNYKGENFHFILLKALSSSNTKDIKGFASENNHFAIVKRKRFNISDDFAFIDPKTQSLYRLKRKVASDDKIIIYEYSNISIFDIMTSFELHSSSTDKLPITHSTKKNPLEEFNFQFEWDEEKNSPKMKNLFDTEIEYGFGADMEVEVDTVLSFNYIWDFKISASISLDATFGGEIKVPDDFHDNFTNIKVCSLSHEIPGLGVSLDFLGLEINFGLFIDFNVIFDQISIEIPIGFDYFKGYKIKGQKHFEISENSIVNPDWNFIITNLPEKSTVSEVMKSIKSSKFNATIDLVPSFAFKFDIGDMKLDLNVGLKLPFQYNFEFDDQKCMFPHLLASLSLPIKMYYEVSDLEIFSFKIFESKYEEHHLKTLNYGTFCLGGDNSRNSETIEDIDCTFELNYQIQIKFSPNEICKNVILNIKEKYLNQNLCVFINQTSNEFQPVYDSYMTALNDNIFILNITSTQINIPIRRNNILYESNATFGFYIFQYGSDKLEELSNTYSIYLSFSTRIYTGFIGSIVNNEFYAQLGGSMGDCSYLKLNINDYKALIIFQSGKTCTVPVTSNVIFISNYQPYVTLSTNFYYHLNYAFHVICSNGKAIKAVINDKIYIQPIVNGKADFKFGVDGDFTFYPICENDSGTFCQIEYETPSTNGYHLIKYPNRNGISRTGGGFLAEIIPVYKYLTFYYYKTYNERIEKIREYEENTFILVKLSITDIDDFEGFDHARRVCIVESSNSQNIIPFSRSYFASNSNEIYDSLGIEKNYSFVKNDQNGCIVFHKDLIKNNKIKPLSSNVCDLPVYFEYDDHDIITSTMPPSATAKKGIYSIEPTEHSTPSATTYSVSGESEPKKKNNKTVIIIISVVSVVVVITIVIVVIIVCNRKGKVGNSNSE